jgi:hypothetical protein
VRRRDGTGDRRDRPGHARRLPVVPAVTVHDAPWPGLVAVARAEAAHAERLMTAHIAGCPAHGCPQCLSLTRHWDRAQRQVAVLASPDPPAQESLFT